VSVVFECVKRVIVRFCETPSYRKAYGVWWWHNDRTYAKQKPCSRCVQALTDTINYIV